MKAETSFEPLAIVGLSCIFPRADGLDAYWRLLEGGHDAITEVPSSHWPVADYFHSDPKAPDLTYARRGGFIPSIDFHPLDFGIPPAALEATDSAQLLGLVVAERALADAGFSPERARDRSRVSVVLGVTSTLELVIPLGARLGHPIWRRALREAGVDAARTDEVVRRISSEYVEWQEGSFPGLLGNVVAGRIANRLDLGGTNCVVDAACASSLGAIHLAALELQARRSDVVVTGGVDTFNDIFMYMCFSKTPALSPSGDARPFDARGDGTALGEGLGMLVLERLADAERDGHRIYAVIRGIGSSSDGRGQAIYAPSAAGQAAALERAYASAGISPATIDLVEAHGTGTAVGDATEAAALTEVFRAARPEGSWCALGSVKSQIGHTKAAAGAAGLIKLALALHRRVLPPTIKVTEPLAEVAPGASPFYINSVKRPWLARPEHPRRGAVSAFGFGGSNFHVVLEEHVAARAEIAWDGGTEILALSAAGRDELAAGLARERAADPAWDALRERAERSRRDFRGDRAFRLLCVLERDGLPPNEVAARAERLLVENTALPHWSSPEGIYFGSGAAPGKLGIVFPGQGSQYTGMMRDLSCLFPQMQAELEAADRAYWDGDEERRSGRRLSDAIYPHPTFTPAAAEQDEIALRNTAVAQPAIGAVSLGAFRSLEHFGVAPHAVAGHSFGELTALCAAQRLSPAAFHTLGNFRGRLMAEPRGDRGAMLAVSGALAEVERTIAAERLDLVIANRNAPEQVVVSGASGEVERAEAHFGARRLETRRLPVSAAFHSPLVADARAPFLDALRKVTFAAERCPVFANSSAERYPASAARARALLAGQIAEPVRFLEEIRNMHRFGVHTFLEVGPSAKLTGLIQSILAQDAHAAIALDASRGKRSGTVDLARALARLAALGHAVEVGRWEERPRAPARLAEKSTFTVTLNGANLKPKPRRETRAAPEPVAPRSSESEKETMTAPGDPLLLEALRAARDNLQALERMQEQTARVHEQFLTGQAAALAAMQALMAAQSRLSGGGVVEAPNLPQLAPPAPAAPETPRALPSVPSEVRPALCSVADTLRRVVAEKTGYPEAMLELSMEMDADLGIDSIKRVEILSALKERIPDARAVRPEELGSLRTLQDVVALLDAGREGALPVAAGEPVARADAIDSVADALLAVVAEKTGYPQAMLELSMEMDADLGIDSIKRVEILSGLKEKLPALPAVRPEDLGSLRTLGDVVALLRGSAAAPAALPQVDEGIPSVPALPPARPLERRRLVAVEIGRREEEGRIAVAPGAAIWIQIDGTGLAEEIADRLRMRGFAPRLLSAKSARRLKRPDSLGGLLLLTPAEGASDAYLEDALHLAQSAAAALRAQGKRGGALLATVSRLDGSFGLAESGIEDPTSGGLAGLVKCAAKEWPEVTSKAIDLAPGWVETAQAAAAIVDEIFIPAPCEVGISPSGRRTLELVEAPIPSAELPIAPGDVVVITGGARGVTAAVSEALAARGKPVLVLIGRTAIAAEEPGWLAGLDDEGEVKRRILAESSRRLSPRELGAEYARIQAAREVRAHLARLRTRGATVHYRAVDVRDAEALSAALADVRRDFGPIRAAIHGAGVLADQSIAEKSAEGFARVYDTKVKGLRHLVAALDPRELRVLVLFSSVTARLGRAGQVDYAMANEVLNKTALRLAAEHRGMRVRAVNWGPWDGGMVTAAHRTLFEQEGMDLIPLAAGGEHCVAEMTALGPEVEVVVAGSGGLAPRHALSATAAEARPRPAAEHPIAFTRQLDLYTAPFLGSHVLDGRPVLPLAMILEWLAHGALHANPGFLFGGLSALRVLKGVVLPQGTSETLRVHAGKATRAGEVHEVPVELRGTAANGREILHAAATVCLRSELARGEARLQLALDPYPYSTEAIYRELLFHGVELQGIVQVEGCSSRGIAGSSRSAPPPRQWLQSPLRSHWISDPLILDCAFQLSILWALEHLEAHSLPCAVGRYRQFQRRFPSDGARILVAVRHPSEHALHADIEILDSSGKLVADFEDYECVVDASLAAAFRTRSIE